MAMVCASVCAVDRHTKETIVDSFQLSNITLVRFTFLAGGLAAFVIPLDTIARSRGRGK